MGTQCMCVYAGIPIHLETYSGCLKAILGADDGTRCILPVYQVSAVLVFMSVRLLACGAAH